MDLDDILRDDRCQDRDELINFWARSGSQSIRCRNRIVFSDIVCTATRNFITSKKSRYWAWVLGARRSSDDAWFWGVETPLSEVNALYRVLFWLLVTYATDLSLHTIKMLFCCLRRNVETSCHNKLRRLLPAISVTTCRGTNNSTPSRCVAWRLCAILCEFSVADTFLPESVPSH